MKVLSNELYPLFNNNSGEYIEAVTRVLNSGWYILGKEVEEFEYAFAKYLNAKYCIGVANGLDALELALKVYDLQNVDAEIIVPANTYIATILAITNCGLKPVFIEPNEFYNIDVTKVESLITSKTKAIINVNLYGQACDMMSLRNICYKYNLLLIEDCAQSHGAKYDGEYTNKYSDISCFSFYPSKNLGAFGDAGAIVFNDESIYKKLKALRNYGSDIRYHNRYTGKNSRLDEMQAALLLVKLKYFNDILKERENIANKYLCEIKNNRIILPKIANKCTHVWHLFVLRVKNRDRFINYMNKKGIEILIHYPIPPYLQECYKGLGYKKGDFPITEKYADEVVTLPMYNGMEKDKIDYVIESVNEYYE